MDPLRNPEALAGRIEDTEAELSEVIKHMLDYHAEMPRPEFREWCAVNRALCDQLAAFDRQQERAMLKRYYGDA